MKEIVAKNNYQKRKEEARQKAINIQNDMATNDYSYGELLEFQVMLEKVGKRYGLTKELKENGLL